ncbi:MAG: ABC transporter permease [Candidatus Omnitrophota bacterium]|nr:MAG: ABC transporter permease [Candidatus Omnitrophota bacterium]
MGPLFAAMIILLILFGVMVPNFLTRENLLDLLQQISVNAIIAFGMTLTIMIGGIDLSVGAVLALVGTSTIYVLSFGDAETQSLLHFVLAILTGLGVAGAFGAFNGVCAAKTKMPPFIITLATMMIARGSAYCFNQARPIPIADHQTVFLTIGNGRLFGVIPIPVLIMLVLFAVAGILLHRTRFGQHLYAIGGNREAARFTGIPLARTQIIVYILCAVFTGIAGMINVSQLYSAEPAAGIGFELDAIAAAVVGGTSFTGGIGTMNGTLIGAIIIGILDKGLNQAGVHFSIQDIVKGFVILAAVYMDVRRRK